MQTTGRWGLCAGRLSEGRRGSTRCSTQEVSGYLDLDPFASALLRSPLHVAVLGPEIFRRVMSTMFPSSSTPLGSEAALTPSVVGTPGDYNQWRALGNEGWGYEDLEPYFVKSEKTHSLPGSKYRGKKGMSCIGSFSLRLSFSVVAWRIQVCGKTSSFQHLNTRLYPSECPFTSGQALSYALAPHSFFPLRVGRFSTPCLRVLEG